MDIMRQVVVFDAADLAAESAFWAAILDGHVFTDERFHTVFDGDGNWRIGVQLAPDHVPPDWPNGNPQQVQFAAGFCMVGFGRFSKTSWYGDCLPSRDFPLLADLHLQGQLPLEDFVSGTIGLGDVEAASHRMERGEVLRSVVLLSGIVRTARTFAFGRVHFRVYQPASGSEVYPPDDRCALSSESDGLAPAHSSVGGTASQDSVAIGGVTNDR